METNTLQAGRLITETPRLILREMQPEDLDALCHILCDTDVMKAAYERPFTREEAQGWLGRHLRRYEQLGFGLWAVVLKETGQMIGQCGLTLQPWRDSEVPEVGYLFRRSHWHRGYATEAARACMAYAFSTLHFPHVHSMIRDTHTASRRVAERCGMQVTDQAVKTFRDMEMTFLLYTASAPRKG